MNIVESIELYLASHKNLIGKSPIILACSGGADSVALGWALMEMKLLFPNKIIVVHINHQLRGKESDKDAVFVKSLAKQWGWPFVVRKRKIQKLKSGNLEQRARDARYSALMETAKKYHSHLILTAHNLDDQAETIFMNILRGSSTLGLSGMASLRKMSAPQMWLGRPFLAHSKVELKNFLKKNRRSFREDKSNRDNQYRRNWLRINVIPLIEKRLPKFKKKLSQMASIFQGEESFWSFNVTQMEKKLVRKVDGGVTIEFKIFKTYPVALQRRFLRQAIGPDLLSFDAIEGLRHWMQSPPTRGRVKQLRKGWIAERLSKSKGSPSPSLFWLGQSKKMVKV